MADFITGLRPFMILGDLTELVVASTAPDVTVKVASDGVPVFSESFIPSEGKVTVHNFQEILAPLVSQQSIALIQLTVKDTNSTATRQLYVLYCAISLPSSFVDTHFLSMGQEQRDTFPDADEVLYFASTTATDDNAYCTVIASLTFFREATNEVFSEDVEVGRFFCLNTIARVDVSPRKFQRAGCVLLSFGIYAEHRQMAYKVQQQPAPFPVYFRNAFGLYETAYFWGAVKTSISGERATAWINGSKQNYKVDTSYEWEANSGLVNAGAIALMADLARSREVLISPMDVKLNVLVTDLKLEADNDDSSLNSCKVTLVQAKKNQPLFSGASDVSGIFDNSFDTTFN